MRRKKDSSNIINVVQEKPLLTKKISKTLSEGFKPVSLKNYEFKNLQNMFIDWTCFCIFGYQDSNTRKKTGNFSKAESSESKTHSIQTFMGDFKALVFEKAELEYRDMSILIALLPILAYQISIPM